MLTQKTNHKRLSQKLILSLVTVLMFVVLPAPAFALFGKPPADTSTDTTTPSSDASTTDPSCLRFLNPPNTGVATDNSKQCESTTPEACKGIDPSTSAGESKLEDCLSQHALLPSSNPIVKDLNVIVDFLSAGIGIVITATVIIGGIQYSIAGNSPEAVGKAKKRITNGVIAFAAFIFIFAFLQWLIPGGVFNS